MNPNFNTTNGFKFPFGNVDNNPSSISKFQWGFLRGLGEREESLLLLFYFASSDTALECINSVSMETLV